MPPSTRAKCAGCGAPFQCNNSSLPGFVPISLFEEVENNARKKLERQRNDYMCRRCYLQKEFNFLLNVNVCPVDYQALMGHLKLLQEALIILVVDMADLECSIHQDLPR
uniref:Uncharacterized protein n=1 Tax=Ditylenchus dipsaci TaxID=166011 RepID=A0A915E4C7_9BILA